MSAATLAPANGRLKIEMVLPSLYKAGMEVMAARLGQGLVSRDHDIGFTCIQSGGALADELRDEGYRVAVVPAPGVRSLVRAPQLTTWLAGLRPDVVHAHTGAWLKAAHAARQAGIRRVVHTEHGVFDGEPWHRTALNRCAAHYTDHVVAVAEPIRAYLTSRVGVNANKVSVILNGVDTNRFTPATRPRGEGLRARLGLAEGAFVVGNVARLDSVKNHALLIRAFALLHEQIPEATLVIVGDGALRGELEASIATLRLDSDVHLLGEVRDVRAVYRDLDLFVLSSTSEGTSMSILEAMASGVCVVATAVGGNPDLLGLGRYGVLVPPGDAAALAVAMADLQRDPTRRQSMATAARKQAVTRHSEDAVIRAYEELYHGWSHGQCAG